jgi:hypothetical protein
MSKRITRRELLRDIGAAGATTLLAVSSSRQAPAEALAAEGQTGQPSSHPLPQSTPSKEPSPLLSNLPRGPRPQDLVEIRAGEMVVAFDRRYGSISSITRKDDSLRTNFIGNEYNTPGVDVSNSRWTGDLVTAVWEVTDTNPAHRNWTPRSGFVLKGRWRRELTGRSADIRRVDFDGKTFSVEYRGTPASEDGIRSFDLTMKFRGGEDSSLMWNVELQNVTDRVLELGDLGFPLMVNDDQGEYYIDPQTGQPFPPDETEAPLRDPADSFAVVREQYPRIARQYFEQKVISHYFAGGHSSYVLIQRARGDAPFLLLHAVEGGAIECVYRDDSSFGERSYWWDGPNILAVHSWATRNLRGWNKNPWINGHTSLVLQPGEKWSCQLRFAFVDSYDAIREELYSAGNLGIRVIPAMVVQEDTDAYVEVKAKSDVDKIDFLSDNITVKEKKRTGDKTLLTLSFKGRGQKSLKLRYGSRWTNVHFYCVEDIAQLLKTRANFIVEREFYENPTDPYHRNHLFLPFDHRIGSTFLDSDEVSEVGGSDAEFGFSEPLFLAEKNIYYPSPKEVATLETYVADCLFKYIQDPETYDVRASLYWKLRYPSSPWSHWNEERANATYRAYNYAHVANIYHALYRIGKLYDLLTRKSARDYLKMAFHTSVHMFRTDPWGHVGVMGGANSLNIMEDLGREGLQAERGELFDEIGKCNQVFLKDPYPYSSEYPVDTTAQEQVYFFTRYFGNTDKNLRTLQVMRALRGGNQPVWFQCGNDNKGDLTCWYTESTNGWVLLRAFEDAGDLDTLIKGFAGVMSVAVDLLPDGMCFAHFLSTPGIFDFTPPRTLDGGIAQFGFLKAAKAYVIQDDSFGLIGCGCRVESSTTEIRVYPQDGLRKRLRFVPQKIDLEVAQGEIDRATLIDEGGQMELSLSDSTQVVKKAELEIKGLAKGDYMVRYGSSANRISVFDTLRLSLLIVDAKLIRIEKL